MGLLGPGEGKTVLVPGHKITHKISSEDTDGLKENPSEPFYSERKSLASKLLSSWLSSSSTKTNGVN